MTGLFISLTLISSVMQNCLFNKVSKRDLKTDNQAYYFNLLISLVCLVLFGMLLLKGELSLFTALLGILFGIMTALRNVYSIQALAHGPMNITLLITTSSTIIPTLSGMFFGELFSIKKLIAVLILLGFINLSLEKDNQSKINKKWALYVLFAFGAQGIVGVLQKVHQVSVHKEEVSGFLFVAFVFAFLYNRIRIKAKIKALDFKRKNIFFAIICGLCTFSMNYLNLKLAGLLPSQLFFPLVNGGSMILSQIMSVVIFKEIPTKKQSIGIVGGIFALITICIIK